MVRGDQLRLRQVLINLVGNALKFTMPGQVTIFGELSDKTESTMQFHFTISDTGIGIPVEKRHKILKPSHKQICPPSGATVERGSDCPSLSGW